MNAEMQHVRQSGREAAQSGHRRSSNPHPVNAEEWCVWMDAFDLETVTIERLADGRRSVPSETIP